MWAQTPADANDVEIPKINPIKWEYLSFLLLAFLPSDITDQSSKRFLPGVHLDDSNSRHHLVHGADPAVSQHRRLTPEGNKKKERGI